MLHTARLSPEPDARRRPGARFDPRALALLPVDTHARAAQCSSPVHWCALPASSAWKRAAQEATTTMPSATPSKLAAMLSTWTDGSDDPLLEALRRSLSATPLEPAHETGLIRCAVAGATTGAMARSAVSKPSYLFWSLRFSYAVVCRRPNRNPVYEDNA